MKNLLKMIRLSIKEGYLPTDWHDSKDDVVELHNGRFAMNDDTTLVKGDYYHSEIDSELFVYDERDEDFILIENACYCYGRNGRQYWTNDNNCIKVHHDWYDTDFLGDNDIVYLEDTDDYCHIEDAYYSDEDGCWYSEEPDSGPLWAYGEGEQESDFRHDDKEEGQPVFGFGVEIEKSQMPSFYFDKEEIHYKTGAVLERDGSVPDGFELKTPIYNLLSSKTDQRILDLKPFCDIKGVENAGGHIGFSMEGKSDQQLMDLCAGFIPLIFAMYKKRLQNSYCSGKKIDELKKSYDKMQAIRMRGNYIEFRIFSSIKTFETLKFRLQLFRIIANNLGRSFSSVIGMAVNKNSELNKLLTGDVYADAYKFERLIKDAIEINKEFGHKALNQSKINQITNKLTLLKCA
jgi:hypothetical protein